MTFRSFFPPVRTLMGPGPSDVNPRVLAAMSRPIVGHMDPVFIAMMEDMKGLLQYAFQTENALTLPVSAPGSAGMETCFANLVEPGDKVIVCINGVFGGRMRENIQRYGGIAVTVEDDWGQPVSLQKVEEALRGNPDASLLAFVHAETSTGACSDVEALCELARRHDCLSIVDAVTSLGGIPLRVDDWGIDAVYSGSQKCLSCTPGLAPVSFSERAVARIRGRKTPVQSWFLDLNLVMGYWVGSGGKRAYHHTAPINALYALHEALRAGIEAMGMPFLVDEAHRLPQLNAVMVPQGVDEMAVRTALLDRYSLEIGAGLGPYAGRIWRIGLMGHAANERNVLLCLGGLETVLAEMDVVTPGHALPAARAIYSEQPRAKAA